MRRIDNGLRDNMHTMSIDVCRRIGGHLEASRYYTRSRGLYWSLFEACGWAALLKIHSSSVCHRRASVLPQCVQVATRLSIAGRGRPTVAHASWVFDLKTIFGTFLFSVAVTASANTSSLFASFKPCLNASLSCRC